MGNLCVMTGTLLMPGAICAIAGWAFDGEKLCYAGYSETDGLCKTPIWLERPYVIDSGSDHAMTAMDMGATAAESVEMAKKRGDTSTGGVVRKLFVADHPTTR